jgi:hypothetical protein
MARKKAKDAARERFKEYAESNTKKGTLTMARGSSGAPPTRQAPHPHRFASSHLSITLPPHVLRPRHNDALFAWVETRSTCGA